MKLKCGHCGTIHAVGERNIPENGVKMVRCDGCDNHFLISNDYSVQAKYEASRRICQNCAKEVPVEAKQCQFCEYFFNREHRFKNKRIQQQRYRSFSSSDRRRKRRRLLVVALLLAAAASLYYLSGSGTGSVGRLVRFLTSGGRTTSITIAEPSHMLKLASGGRIYVVSYKENGDLLEVEDQRGVVFTIALREIVEIVPVP